MAFLDEEDIKPLASLQKVRNRKQTINEDFVREAKGRSKELARLIDVFYKSLFPCDIKVFFDEEAFDIDLKHSNRLAEAIQDMMDGVSYAVPDKVQIYPICMLILFYLKISGNTAKFLIQGVPQIGKTLVLIFTALLIINIKKLKGENVLPLIFVPSAHNNKNDFVNELRVMLSILKYIVVEKGNQKVSLSGCLDEQLRDNNLCIGNIVIMRNPSGVKEVDSIMNKINDVSILPITDECDYGSGEDQIMDKLDTKYFGIWLREILNSATPDEGLAGSNIWRFPILIPPSYCGNPDYCGKLPSAHSIFEDIPPGIKYIDVEAIDAKFPELSKYLDFKDRENNIGDFVESFVSITRKIKDHIFLRPFAGKSVVWCQDIALLLRQKLKRKWAVVLYAGEVKNADVIFLPNEQESFGERSLKEVLVSLRRRNYRIIVVSSSARSKRGDSYPYWFRHFIDFSDSSTYMNTEIQSTLGRACGHLKDSICYFKQSVVNVIADFRKNYGRSPVKNFSSRTGSRKIYRNKTQTTLLSFEGEDS